MELAMTPLKEQEFNEILKLSRSASWLLPKKNLSMLANLSLVGDFPFQGRL
ncbi:hypothetical protein JWG45_17185 [Leptospira sp. 201903070]|uniref:Uncharacterized protein n=1 Tax=Leptospira ainlahdjerensis TaxID=2810033 RepID=A0ABS2UHV3_9LEPT|nr:hypothetical protein [Leptospira ainlahdjerensis]MBM9578882.1 hypothetical protein [Leptospira ainlahdjerensis]